jgi:hypothetical protein
MNIIAIIGFGRSGMDFLQSLFDKHPQISQFPGEFFFGKFYTEVEKKTCKKEIAELFIKKHLYFFDSRLNLTERHNSLGNKKNEFFLIKKNLFKKKFIQLTNTINKKEIFINLHIAYSYACGENIKKKKIIIINAHQIEQLYCLADFDYQIFFTIRDPVGSLTSTIKHWLKYENGKHVGSWWLYYQINRVFNSIKEAVLLNKKIHIIKLDILHKKNKFIMRQICKILKIKFNKSLTQSTYMGKKWWGDKLSVKFLDGVNKNFSEKIDNSLFYPKDINYLNYYLKSILKKYNYTTKSKLNNFNKFLPLKIEILIWTRLIKLLKVKEIFLIPYYWLKRIVMLKKNQYKNIRLPNEIYNTHT